MLCILKLQDLENVVQWCRRKRARIWRHSAYWHTDPMSPTCACVYAQGRTSTCDCIQGAYLCFFSLFIKASICCVKFTGPMGNEKKHQHVSHLVYIVVAQSSVFGVFSSASHTVKSWAIRRP